MQSSKQMRRPYSHRGPDSNLSFENNDVEDLKMNDVKPR